MAHSTQRHTEPRETQPADTAAPTENTVDQSGDTASTGDAAQEPAPGQHAGFLPAEPARLGAESVFVRLVATAGIIGIGTLLGALLVANNVAGWITGLVVSAVSVILAAVLWRSRTL
jgi:hypothetical protein